MTGLKRRDRRTGKRPAANHGPGRMSGVRDARGARRWGGAVLKLPGAPQRQRLILTYGDQLHRRFRRAEFKQAKWTGVGEYRRQGDVEADFRNHHLAGLERLASDVGAIAGAVVRGISRLVRAGE